MIYTKMTFSPYDKTMLINAENIDEISNPIWSYLGSLYQNGQIYKDVLVQNGNELDSNFFMPEADSISEKNSSKNGIQDLQHVNISFQIKIQILGKNAMEYPVCNCEKSTWYILYSNRAYEVSPIICGDCFGMIPLYKWNHVTVHNNIRTILGWQDDYDLIDKLWLNSSFDWFTYKQMSQPNSQLSKDGIAICKAYGQALGVPIYYFLFYDSEYKKKNQVCPLCAKEWKLIEGIGNINRKCDKCKIVSL